MTTLAEVPPAEPPSGEAPPPDESAASPELMHRLGEIIVGSDVTKFVVSIVFGPHVLAPRPAGTTLEVANDHHITPDFRRNPYNGSDVSVKG